MASNAKSSLAKRERTGHRTTGAVNPYVRARKQRFYAILGTFIVFASIFTFQIVHTKVTLAEVNQQAIAQKANLVKATDDRALLKDKVKQMNNKDYLQQVVRNKYLFTKKGETVYSLPADADK